MKISSVKNYLAALLYFISFLSLYSLSNTSICFDENAPFNAKTFPIYLGYTGMLLSGLKMILPEKT